MKISDEQANINRGESRFALDGKLAGYLAATGAIGSYLASEAGADIVGNPAVQPFGINGTVDIDFNSDGQIDFQIDHDRVNLDGNNLDYLQLDKNDVNSETDPLPIDSPFFASTFPPGATTQNNPWLAGYITSGAPGDGLYPSALTKGTFIGPKSAFDWQEGDNFMGNGTVIRVNRLIDEDAGQIDTANSLPAQSPLPGSPNFVGLGESIRYLGVRASLNGGNPLAAVHEDVNYGWIGIQITNPDDATGNVVGWAYETEPNKPIPVGHFVPEPGSILMAAIGGAFLAGGLLTRTLFRGRKS